MADGYVSSIHLPNDNTYDIKDKNAVTEIQINGIAQTKTNGVVNLPDYPTDTKVTQGNTTASGVRPLVMEYNSYVISSEGKNIETDYISEDTTNKVYRTNNIYASPASGRLYLSSTSIPQVYLKYRTLDYTLADNGMSSEQWIGYRVIDKNSKVVALFYGAAFPNGKIGAFMRASNYDTSTTSATAGYIGVLVDKSSNVSYLVSDPDKFREAIDNAAYIGANTITNNQVIIADGTDGKLKSSGYTIESSVPSSAVFTDENVLQENNTDSKYSPIALTGEKYNNLSSYSSTSVTTKIYKTGSAFLRASDGTFYGGAFVACDPISAGTSSTTSKRTYINSNGLYTNNYMANYSIAAYGRQVITSYPGKCTSNNGLLLKIDSGGLTIVGGGESGANLAELISNDQTIENPDRLDINNSAGASGKETTAFTGDDEQLILSSDNNIYFATNCQTPKNRVAVCLNSARAFYPMTDNSGSIGSSSYRWANGYFANGYFKLLNGINDVDYTKEEDSGDTKYPAKWYCNMGKTPADGDTVTITVPAEGGDSNGVYLSIEGNTNAKYKPISVSKTTKLTTHFSAGEIITLVYRAAGSTATIYPINGGTATTTVSEGCWSVLNYYNTNTDTKVTDTVGTANTFYPAGKTGTGSGTVTQVFDTALKFAGTSGTTSVIGKAELTLGNATASGADNNKQGSLIIYGTTKYAHTIKSGESEPTAARSLTLPNKSGTIAVTSDIIDEKVAQEYTTSGNDYRVLFSYDANDMTETKGARKNQYLLFNPSSQTLTVPNVNVTTINGVTVGSTPKFTDKNVLQSFTTKNDSTQRPVLLSGLTDNTDQAYKSYYLIFNPYYKMLQIGLDNNQGSIKLYSTGGENITNDFGIIEQSATLGNPVTHYLPSYTALSGNSHLLNIESVLEGKNIELDKTGNVLTIQGLDNTMVQINKSESNEGTIPSSSTTDLVTSISYEANAKYILITYGRPYKRSGTSPNYKYPYLENFGSKIISTEVYDKLDKNPYVCLSLVGDIGDNVYIRKKAYKLSAQSGQGQGLVFTPVTDSGREITISTNGTVTSTQNDDALIIYTLSSYGPISE